MMPSASASGSMLSVGAASPRGVLVAVDRLRGLGERLGELLDEHALEAEGGLVAACGGRDPLRTSAGRRRSRWAAERSSLDPVGDLEQAVLRRMALEAIS